MLWISFSRWNLLATNHLVQKRVWLRGYIWTPLVIVKFRRQWAALKYLTHLRGANKSQDVGIQLGAILPSNEIINRIKNISGMQRSTE